MTDYIHKIYYYGVIGDIKSSSLSNFPPNAKILPRAYKTFPSE